MTRNLEHRIADLEAAHGIGGGTMYVVEIAADEPDQHAAVDTALARAGVAATGKRDVVLIFRFGATSGPRVVNQFPIGAQ